MGYIIGTSAAEVINGTSSGDDIHGNEGDDTIYGGGSGDRLVGGAGDDYMEGGADNDVAYGQAGDDTFYGGEGDDYFFADHLGGDDVFYGGDNTSRGDHLSYYNQWVNASITLTSNDSGYSTTSNGRVDFYGVEAFELARMASSFNANGFAVAGMIHGGIDNDQIAYGSGDAFVRSYDGNDVIVDGNGESYDGDDLIESGAGNDQIRSGGGNDTLNGGTGNDVMHSEGGDATFILENDYGNDQLHGGEVDDVDGDTIDLSKLTTDATISFLGNSIENGKVESGSNKAQFHDVEHFILGQGADTVVMSSVAGNISLEGFGLGVDMIDFSALKNDSNKAVTLDDMTISVDAAGNAVLSFPRGESVTLVGVTVEQLEGVDVGLGAIDTTVTAPDYLDDMTIVGTSAEYVAETGEYVLTNAANWEYGLMQDDQAYALNEDFTFAFDAYLGEKDGPGADGITWFMHADREAALNPGGNAGGGFGSGGLNEAFVLELDTWNNGSGSEGIDTAEDHVMLRAQYDDGAGLDRKYRQSEGTVVENLEDGEWHAVEINWEAATQTLSWSLDGEVLDTATFDAGDADGDGFSAADLATVLSDADEVYFGVTAATGAANNLQKVRNVELEAAESTVVIEETPEEPETPETPEEPETPVIPTAPEDFDGEGRDDGESEGEEVEEETVDTRADLQISALNFAKGNGNSDDTFVVADITNAGEDTARKVTTTFYWSATDTFDAETAVELGVEASGSIRGGDTDEDEGIRIREEVLEELGSGFIFAVADDLGRVDEADETNNVSEALAITVTGEEEVEEEPVVEEVEVEQAPADIVMQKIKLSSSTVTPGDDVEVTVKLGNLGETGAKSVETTIYWSATDEFDPETAIAIEMDNHGYLKAGTSGDTETLTLRYRDIAEHGDGYLFAVADPDDKIEEGNEENNISEAVAITLAGGEEIGEVDLAIKKFTIKDTELEEGEDLRIVMNVANEGTEKARATYTTFYWSETEEFDFNTAEVIGTDTHQTLDGGEIDKNEKQRVEYEDIAQFGDGYVFGFISSNGVIDVDPTDNLAGGIWIDIA